MFENGRACPPPDTALQLATNGAFQLGSGTVLALEPGCASGPRRRGCLQLSARSIRRQRSQPIESLLPVPWAGVLLFGGLGCFFLQKAVRRRASRRWGWGRTGAAAPLSRASYAVWGVTFLVIAAIVSGGAEVSGLLLGLLAACFVALAAAGVRDARAEKRRHDSI